MSKKEQRKINLLKRDNYRCGIHLGGCSKEITIEETSVDHIIPQNILSNDKEYIKLKKFYKVSEKKSLDNGLFNLQPMCFNCNNSNKQGIFPPRNIIKKCSNRCCKFIYVETKNGGKSNHKHYLIFTHYLLKEAECDSYQKEDPSQIMSVAFIFPLTDIQFQRNDGTRTEKLYTLFGQNKEFRGWRKKQFGGMVLKSDMMKNNQQYSEKELSESSKTFVIEYKLVN